MNDDDDEYAYVAADPDQPGAAWGVCSDRPEYKKDTAKDLARWLRQGAIIERVTVTRAREMLAKWERPKK